MHLTWSNLFLMYILLLGTILLLNYVYWREHYETRAQDYRDWARAVNRTPIEVLDSDYEAGLVDPDSYGKIKELLDVT